MPRAVLGGKQVVQQLQSHLTIHLRPAAPHICIRCLCWPGYHDSCMRCCRVAYVCIHAVQVTEMFEQLSTMVVDSTRASVSDLAGKQQQVRDILDDTCWCAATA